MDITPPKKRLEEAIAQYFEAERKGGLLLIGWSFLGLIVTAYLLLYYSGTFEKGVVFPIATIALIHLIAGVGTFIQSNKQLRLLQDELIRLPPKAVKTEQVRMEKVMANFEKYQKVEMLLFFLGFAFVIGGAFGNLGDFTLGTGIGLSIQAAFTLVFDLFAAYRGGFYQHELKMFMKNL